MTPDYFVDHRTIHQRIDDIDPAAYARSRNHLSGAVTHLSPLITHGVIDTSTVANVIVEKYNSEQAEKLLTELAWREFFHRVWQVHGDGIFSDMRQPQENVATHRLPAAVLKGNTGIATIDECISTLATTGYMHNHARLWVAAVTCNTARTHWYQPARWLYYHLLDGDLASNSLSWQWVAGSFSHRKYYANQDNLNRFSQQTQTGTFLDVSYEELPGIDIPDALHERMEFSYENQFPASTATPVDAGEKRLLLHSIWNLDPEWRTADSGRRILWIEPSQHIKFALSPKRWKFIEHWARQIRGLEIFVGEYAQLFPHGTNHIRIISREYPATTHWPTGLKGEIDRRRWCHPQPQGAMRSKAFPATGSRSVKHHRSLPRHE